MRMSDTLSLADVARLSGVQRPVVSMWRKRPKAGLRFPEPTADGRFLAEEITAYLEATGRGNNPEVGGMSPWRACARPTGRRRWRISSPW